jgi:hypothetical protein
VTESKEEKEGMADEAAAGDALGADTKSSNSPEREAAD